MPLELIIFAASTILGGAGVALKKGCTLGDRIDQLELKVCEKYATRDELNREFDRIALEIDRINNRLEK